MPAAAAPSTAKTTFNLDTFLSVTSPQIFRVTGQPWSDGGVANFTLPQTGLASCLMINIAATITVAGTITSGKWKGWPNPAPFGIIRNLSLSSNQNLQIRNHSLWGMYKWLRMRYAFDPFATPAGSYSAGTNTLIGVGALAIQPGANVTAGTYVVNMSFPMPIAYNRECLTGLLMLQNNSIQYILSLQYGNITGGISATGGTNDLFNTLIGTSLVITAAVNVTCDIEIMQIPANYPPNLSMFMSVLEYSQTPINTGQNVVKPSVSDVFTMFLLEVVNNGLPVPPANITTATYVYSGNLRRYDEDYVTKLGFDMWQHSIQPMDGVIMYDMGIRKGLVEKRDLFDAFNDTVVTDLQLQMNLSSAITVAAPNQITVIAESLRFVQQR